MAEETEKVSETECKALYNLIVKKDLSDEEKAQIKTVVESKPQILAQEEFTKNFKLTDFAFECEKAEDLPQLLNQNTIDIEVLNTALTNLKDCHVVHNGKDKTAAKYLLDTPVLKNGELVGTQLAKNIHFLGAAQRDTTVPEASKELIASSFAQNEAFYKSLYAEDGYRANPNARNLSGQKVEKLMLECIAARTESRKAAQTQAEEIYGISKESTKYMPYIEKLDDSIEKVKTRAFMQHPQKERATMVIEAPRASMNVEAKRETATFESYKTKAYLGTLTVDEKEKFDKMKKAREKKEDEMANKPNLNPHRPEDKEHKDKFKEMDIIDYMYQEWFLAGLSWLFDKAEDLVDAALDRLICTRDENRARREHELHEARSARAAEALEKVHIFEDGVKGRLGHAAAKRASRDADLAARIKPLKDVDFTHLDASKEHELKSLYSPYLIEGLKMQAQKSPEAVKEFLEKCPQREKNACKDADNIEQLAMNQIETEMIGEVMHSTGAWRKKFKSDFKSDEDLLKEYDKRVEQRKTELGESVAAIRADARILTESNLLQTDADPTKRQTFVKENILDYYDKKIAATGDSKDKQTVIRQKEFFEKTYAMLPDDLRKAYIVDTVANNKAADFLEQQINLETKARQIQDQDRKNGRYDANGRYPQKQAADNMRFADDLRKDSQKTLIDDKFLLAERRADVNAEIGLYEAAFKSDTEKVLESTNNIFSLTNAKMDARRQANNERKQFLLDFKRRSENKKQLNAQKEKTLPLYAGRRI